MAFGVEVDRMNKMNRITKVGMWRRVVGNQKQAKDTTTINTNLLMSVLPSIVVLIVPRLLFP
jgi:hypothetical protein